MHLNWLLKIEQREQRKQREKGRKKLITNK
jgi:hypothetical protein